MCVGVEGRIGKGSAPIRGCILLLGSRRVYTYVTSPSGAVTGRGVVCVCVRGEDGYTAHKAGSCHNVMTDGHCPQPDVLVTLVTFVVVIRSQLSSIKEAGGLLCMKYPGTFMRR